MKKEIFFLSLIIHFTVQEIFGASIHQRWISFVFLNRAIKSWISLCLFRAHEAVVAGEGVKGEKA